MAGCVVVSQDSLRKSSSEDLLERPFTDPTPPTQGEMKGWSDLEIFDSK
jgi:hypothetical protein